MNAQRTETHIPIAINQDKAVERLTALWALSEAALGGLLHAARIPFTGIAVASIAVAMIAMIAFFARRKSAAILKATVIVILIKAAASPHTPPTAYAAVASQGLAGSILFGYLPYPRLAALALGLFALWQGAIQKLVVLTILYGTPLWEAVDAIGRRALEWIGSESSALSPASCVLAVYFGYYTLGGLAAGWLAGVLPRQVERGLEDARHGVFHPDPGEAPSVTAFTPAAGQPTRAPFRIGLVLSLIIITFILLYPGQEGLARGARMFLRALIVVASWTLLIRPLLNNWISHVRRRKQGKYAAEVERTISEMPALKSMTISAWRQTAGGGFGRWRSFMTRLIIMSLTE